MTIVLLSFFLLFCIIKMVICVKNKLLMIMLSLITACSFSIQISSKYIVHYNVLLFLVLLVPFFLFYKKFYNENKKFKILATVFSLFMIIGESFEKTASFKLITHNYLCIIITILKLMGFVFLFLYLLNIFYDFMNKIKIKESKNKIYNFLFEKHPFLIPFIILFICYLPYIISFFPGILSPDPSNQIKQFFHIKTNYLDYTVLLDPNVYITNHHPVLHTVLLGGLAKIGDILGSINIGIFMYTMLQVFIVIGTFSYSISYLRKLNTPYIIRLFILLGYAFIPVFPFYAISVVKDVIFSCLVVLLVIKLFDIIRFKPKYTIKNMITLFLIMLLITLFRNNGIYLVLFTGIPLIIFINYQRLKNIIIVFSVFLLYFIYSNMLLPALKITPGSVRERLSIPFQQTARYVKYYENEIDEDDKIIIDKVLDISDLGKRYNPEKADPVKNKFNKYASSEDIENYFKVWFKYLLKRPNVYIESLINNIYGYYYPNSKKWYIYYKYDERLINDGVNYHYNNLKSARNILSNYGVAFPYIPLIGLIVSIGFNIWLYLTLGVYLIHQKLYKYLIFTIPVLSIILMCFLSPVNTYFRYVLAIIYAQPILWAMYLSLIKNRRKYEEK